MRSVKFTGVLALMLTASCAVQVTTDGSGGSRNTAPQARRAAPPPRAPAPPPPAPPPPAPAPAPAPPPKAATPAPSPAPAPAPIPQQNTAVMPNTNAGKTSFLNLKVVQEIKARNPKNCGFME